MKQLISLLAAAPLVLAASSAFAADPEGLPHGVAVGIDHGVPDLTLGGGSSSAPGISVRYFVTPKVGLNLVGSYDSTSFTPKGGSEASNTALNLSLLAEYRAFETENTAFSFYGGGAMSQGSTSVDQNGTTSSTDTSDMRLELGLKAEYFFARSFSVFGRGGIVVDPLSKDDAPVDGDGTAFSLFGASQPLGTFGFSFWFKKPGGM